MIDMIDRCVYFEMGLEQWVALPDVCEVTNNLDLAIDDYVDCSCKHLTMYAVKSKPSDAGIIGYPIWFFIACFFCMVSFYSCNMIIDVVPLNLLQLA